MYNDKHISNQPYFKIQIRLTDEVNEKYKSVEYFSIQ